MGLEERVVALAAEHWLLRCSCGVRYAVAGGLVLRVRLALRCACWAWLDGSGFASLALSGARLYVTKCGSFSVAVESWVVEVLSRR